MSPQLRVNLAAPLLVSLIASLSTFAGTALGMWWKVSDRIDVQARAAAQSESRQILKDEFGPELERRLTTAATVAATAAIGPVRDEIIRHVAEDTRAQKETDRRLDRIEGRN